jgi:hypothetical protein
VGKLLSCEVGRRGERVNVEKIGKKEGKRR